MSTGEIEVPAGLRDRIVEDNAWDIELYEWAVQNVAVRGHRDGAAVAGQGREQAEQSRRDTAILKRARMWDLRPSPEPGPRQVLRSTSRKDGGPRELYLDLLQRALLGLLAKDPTSRQRLGATGTSEALTLEDVAARLEGRDWPDVGETMVGWKRLANVRSCIESVLDDAVPGDLIEAGVWRGGTTIFMRGILAAHGVEDRRVWVADSFEGLPAPDEASFPLDARSKLHLQPYLAVSESEVRSNFERYDLLDDQVVFLKGWFRDTLAGLEDERFAVVRLDADMYGSTKVSLEQLYPRLSIGGYLIVDDYRSLPTCRRAVDDYRREHGIEEPIVFIDWTGVFWRKVAAADTPSQ
jgi:O-methyltransferase